MDGADRNEIHSFGDWIQRRRRSMGLTQANLAQKVGCAVITIKKIERDERRPSAQIAELLADQLVIPDNLRSEFLHMARGYFVSSANGSNEALRIPPFLQREPAPGQDKTVHFVERSTELDILGKHLAQALTAAGRPVFIFGEAGSGKTTLMTEFARRVQAMNPELVVAGGQCNAQSGLGDPYRPFRDILAMLSGDLDMGWAISGFNRQQALRIWSSIPDWLRTVTLYGPNLVNLFLPVKPLIQRLANYLTGPADWLDQLQTLAQAGQLEGAHLEQSQV
ncbi:MAG TPA: helix-turn-helix domain-containing protein, partial [Anaerolineaceae bacterium]|nr:helix-turn-helix domain-containing protein [Anaerolineaceae bacterium]